MVPQWYSSTGASGTVADYMDSGVDEWYRWNNGMAVLAECETVVQCSSGTVEQWNSGKEGNQKGKLTTIGKVTQLQNIT